MEDFLNWISGAIGGEDGLDLNDVLKTVTSVGTAYEAFQGGDDVVNKPYMMPGQEKGYGTAIATALDDFNQGPDSYYPNPTVAEMDDAWLAGQNDLLASTDRMQGMADAAGVGALTLAQGGVGQVDDFTMPDEIGFGLPQEYQDAIMNPIMRNLNEQIIPNIHTSATAQGAFGGSRMAQQKADAATQATEAATDAMIRGNLQARGQSIGQRAGDINAALTGRGQDIRQNQMINDATRAGVDALGKAIGYQTLPGEVMRDVGMERTAYDQALIDADKEMFDWNRHEGNEYIDRFFNRLGLAPTGGSVQEGSGGGWIDALMGYGAGSNIFEELFGTPTESLGGSK